jgi:hypothetical protein
MALDCEMLEKCLDSFTPQNPRMSSPVEEDEAPDPLDVGLLRPMAVVVEADSLPNDPQQPGMVSPIHVSDSLRYISPPDPGGTFELTRYLPAVNRIIRQICPKTSGHICPSLDS